MFRLPRLIVLCGLPGCGKSTYSRQWVDEGRDHRIRINYDTLRSVMFGDDWRWNRKDEEAMKKAALAQAHEALTAGFDVMVDNTNLTEGGRKPWINLAKSLGLSYEIFEIDVPVAECVRRDSLRTGKDRVGRAVIERMALFNGFIDFSDRNLYPRDFIIVDMDGTVADCDWRRKAALAGPTVHKLTAKYGDPFGEPCALKDKVTDRECPDCGGKAKKNWPLFAANVEKDPPIQPIIDLVERLSGMEYDSGLDAIIVSGREIGPSGKGTEEWLKEHMSHIPVRHLFMRNSQDYRADDIIKQEILDLLPKDRIRYVLDDRERVVQMWRKNGLTCLQVADGKF